MSNSELELPRQQIVFVDYIPAELRVNKEWMIVYYAKNPLTNKLERFRKRPPHLANKRERQRHANRIVESINQKLAEGWSPFTESTHPNSFKTYAECKEKFIELTEKEIRDGIKREDTMRTYRSFLNMIDTYCKDKRIKLTFVLEFNKTFVFNYLDWIYYERGNSPRTYNNHMLFIRTYCNYMIERGFLKENPTLLMVKKRVNKKKRQIITPKIKKVLAAKLPAFNYNFYVLCMVMYYCMIRRTEITKLKVEHINIFKCYIFIPGEISKNKKDQFVSIPEELIHILAGHISSAANDDYVFSDNDYQPGKMRRAPKKVTDTWSVMQKALNIPSEFQLYSLKDTGLDDLFELGIPSIAIRDQARHWDLKTTEMYIRRNAGGDQHIIKSGIKFG